MRADTESGGEMVVALPDPLAGQVQAKGRALSGARPRWWLDALAIVWLALVYDIVTNFAPLRLHAAIGHGQGVLNLEHALHLDPELTLNSWLASHHTLGTVMSYYYDNAHFVVTLGLLGWLWWRRADIYRPLRNWLVLINVLGLAVFWLYPVAPPRMLADFRDVVADSHTFGSWHTGPLASAANQLAAMPSLHMAWAAWSGVVIWQLSRRTSVRTLAIAYPCLTCLAVLATGNHYLLDVFAGLVTAALAVGLARGLTVAGGAGYYALHAGFFRSSRGSTVPPPK